MQIYLDNALGHITIDRMIPYWKLYGHNITTNINDNFDVQISYVRTGLKKKNRPVILRLDSIYYDSATDYNGRNLEISSSHSVADGIVYQSNYSKMLIEKLLKPRKMDSRYMVIQNGIDPGWCGAPVEHEGINITVTGKHRRHKRLKEIVDLFLEYNRLYSDSTLHIFGKLHDNKTIKHKKIKYYGHVDRKYMSDVFKITDFSIHLSKRDSSPNSVVEYIGAGIPVITTNNCGGATEMCQVTPGCAIIDGDGDYMDTTPVPHYGEKWNILPDKVKSGIIQSMVEFTKNKRRVELPFELTSEYMAKKYIQLIQEVL